jgi:hypothetical protein
MPDPQFDSPQCSRQWETRAGNRRSSSYCRGHGDCRVRAQGPIGLITFNRPQTRNAFDAAMAEASGGAVVELENEPELRPAVPQTTVTEALQVHQVMRLAGLTDRLRFTGRSRARG